MEVTQFQINYTLESLATSLPSFWNWAKSIPVWCFSGEMGAGKTTFISNLCQFIGVKDRVSSPSFSLINEYEFSDSTGLKKTIYHTDWFRLKDEQEALNAGMGELFNDSKNFVFVEWPEKANGLLPTEYLAVNIFHLSENERLLKAKLIKE